MSLESGVYNIKCKGTGTYIGRHHDEDLSLLPKRVCSLSNTPKEVPSIVIKKSDNDAYTIKERGGGFAEKNGRLFAVLVEQEVAKWCITPQIGRKDDVYTITKVGEESVGWVVGEPPRGDEVNQVQVMTLATIDTRSLPLQYLPNELFEFIRID